MVIRRLQVRLGEESYRRLKTLASEHRSSMSGMVRRLIDQAYEARVNARRRQAALVIAQMEIEDVPDPVELSRQLNETHDAGVPWY